MSRSDIEGQLELLYNTYYEELENFANMQLRTSLQSSHPHSLPKTDSLPPLVDVGEEDELEGMYDDDEDFYSDSNDSGILEFGTSLTVKGFIY
jgi:hypothetical protein